MHGISGEEWEAYIEGSLNVAERDQLETHLTGCLVCWERVEELQKATDLLRQVGAAARRSLPLRDPQLHAGLQQAFAKLRAAENAADAASIQQRLDALTSVLAVMCGKTTATQALHVAAQRSAARTLDGVSLGNWDSFLARLTSIATVMCGKQGRIWSEKAVCLESETGDGWRLSFVAPLPITLKSFPFDPLTNFQAQILDSVRQCSQHV